jgi:hypothetical protein
VGPVAVIVGLFALFLVGSFAVLAVTGRLDGRGAADERSRPARPRWGSPLVWAGVCAVFALLGLVVAPRLLGGVFLFLPFVWIGGRRRRRPEDGSAR